MSDLQKRLEALRGSTTDGCVSDFELDRLVVEELTATERAAIQARVEACPHCQARLESLLRERRDFASRPDPIWLGRGRKQRLITAVGAAVAVAAAALLFVRAPVEEPGVIRLKGPERFGFIIVAPGGEVRGDQDTGIASPGDELQWRFRTAQRRYIAVLAKDATGRAILFYPEAARAKAIEPGPERSLGMAVELDETLGEEEVIGLICTDAVALEPIRKALERGTAGFPAACNLHRYRLTKTERR
ncbi:MAG: DUF4384 domain-containing protein [Deltaproteobacteria bacterium]|nr:DUF4384 domain-containing protein [Deltaproteobacteria bacterium]NND26966.1 hypothetical protein [Myxococcales bacterium]MBT8467085.1 DUF4384 domain-containing protein [Deltaproteobacteria bacterium]MBT8481826.1 DUF4384 domain-containing protein [Deltaproteobacteria bacterium]NNK08240.1 hypothetical protein [Myxococcales bacterium]